MQMKDRGHGFQRISEMNANLYEKKSRNDLMFLLFRLDLIYRFLCKILMTAMCRGIVSAIMALGNVLGSGINCCISGTAGKAPASHCLLNSVSQIVPALQYHYS